MTYETVNHPPHYNQHPSGVECITIVEHFSHNIGAAVQHLWRAGLKPGADHIDDLRKAAWYIEREIARLTPPAEPPRTTEINYRVCGDDDDVTTICIPLAPAWANWYAEDATSCAWLCARRPIPDTGFWVSGGTHLACPTAHVATNWRQSLRRIVRSEDAA